METSPRTNFDHLKNTVSEVANLKNKYASAQLMNDNKKLACI